MENTKCLPLGRTSVVAREGWPFILLFAIAAVCFLLAGIFYVALPLFLLTIFTAFFFRNPDRRPPDGKDLILAPADGKVIDVSDVPNCEYTGGPAKKISIFMSVFNVHVNRTPVAGGVESVQYHRGKFFVASIDKASKANERNAVLINSVKGGAVAVVQIAGLVARRIVCYLSKGDMVQRGQRLGLIKFGSRVDLYLPVSAVVSVRKKSRVKAGVSIIGRFG